MIFASLALIAIGVCAIFYGLYAIATGVAFLKEGKEETES